MLVLLVVIIAPNFYGRTNTGYLIPTEIVLVLLAVPPILSNTYAGVQNVDSGGAGRGVRDGHDRTARCWRRVELPNALPLIFSGFRSATLQVIATATIASYVTLGGLGRFIYDGLAQQDYPQMISGGLLVAALALVADLLLALVQRYTVSRGITGRFATKRLRQPSATRTRQLGSPDCSRGVTEGSCGSTTERPRLDPIHLSHLSTRREP